MKKITSYLDNVEYVIWDWNGTLLNDLDYTINVLNQILPIHEIGTIDLERHRNLFQFPIFNYYLALGLRLEETTFIDMCNKFVEKYMANIHNCSLVLGVEEILATIQETGVGQSILSAMDQENLSYLVKKYQIKPYFDYVYGISDKLGTSKIERGKELITKLKIKPEKILLIGDTDHDLEVGKAIGVKVLLVSHGHQSYERLIEFHPHVLK